MNAGVVRTSVLSSEGKELVTGVWGPGELFGQFCLCQRRERNERAVVMEDAEIVRLGVEEIIQLVSGRDGALAMLQLFCHRISALEEQVAELAFANVRTRLGLLLLRLAKQGVPQPDGSLLCEEYPTHEEMARPHRHHPRAGDQPPRAVPQERRDRLPALGPAFPSIPAGSRSRSRRFDPRPARRGSRIPRTSTPGAAFALGPAVTLPRMYGTVLLHRRPWSKVRVTLGLLHGLAERMCAEMLISEKDRAVIREMFEELENPVRLVVFTQGSLKLPGQPDCMYCEQTVKLTQELAELSDKVSVEVVNFHTEKEKVEEYQIARIPAIAVVGTKDYGVRYYGIPRGYEFSTLLEDIIDVSKGKTDLSEETLEQLARIDTPVHIQVFVTPTCPYCPSAVRLAHKLAIESDTSRPTWWRPRSSPSWPAIRGVRRAADRHQRGEPHDGGRHAERVRDALRPQGRRQAQRRGSQASLGSSEVRAMALDLSLSTEARAARDDVYDTVIIGRGPGGALRRPVRGPGQAPHAWCWT